MGRWIVGSRDPQTPQLHRLQRGSITDEQHRQRAAVFTPSDGDSDRKWVKSGLTGSWWLQHWSKGDDSSNSIPHLPSQHATVQSKSACTQRLGIIMAADQQQPLYITYLVNINMKMIVTEMDMSDLAILQFQLKMW